MVGVLAENWGHGGAVPSSSVKSGSEILEKMDQLRKLKVVLGQNDPSLLPEFAPLLAELQKDQPSPVRRLLAEIIGEICPKHIELIPKLVPTLISFLKDEAPPVSRQAIASATFLFHNTLERIVVEGLHSSELNESFETSWTWMQNVKDSVFSMALQAGNDGVRLMAIKFVEAMILLYTPDPSGPSSPPEKASDESLLLGDFDLGAGFNISWLRGGHPILKVGDLSTVASQSLAQLLDQLRFPEVKSLSNSIIIVLVNSLSAIAMKRPSYYGRILPVLLCLDPASSVIKGVEGLDAFHALKNAFLAFLKCTHPSAAPWHLRIVEALKTMNAGEVSEAENTSVVDIHGSDLFPSEPFGIKEEEFPLPIDEVNGDHGRKRIKVEEADASIQDDGMPIKKSRISPTTSKDIATDSFHENTSHFNGDLSTDISSAGYVEGDDEPVHQLVGVVGALVAQGSKAASSLDILISSISSDLLAEMVLANMHHLPLSCPKTEQVDESALDILSSSLRDDQPINPSSSFVSDILSLSTRLSSLMNVQHPAHDILTSHSEGEERPGMLVDASLLSAVNDANKTKSCFPTSPYQETIAETDIAPAIYTSDLVSGEGKIPGLGSTDHIDAVHESKDFSPYFNPELQGGSQDHISSGSLPLDTASSGSMSTCISETVATRTAFLDAGEVPSTSSNSVISSNQFFLPKMTVPAVDLTERQRDHLHKVTLMRMTDAHKQISLAGGSNIHFSLLACLGIECPLELEAWGLLQKHILSDYINHEGHELTLRVLYRLFQESEQDQDFFSSTTATSDYEKFLVTVAENLRDLFPASDKSLNRLLCEAPYLPQSVLKLLECLCSPDINAKSDKELPSGDRVTQGLISVWNLILQRPSNRDACLRIALQSAVHRLEEVRMKAIRLVANKLFPISCIAQKIEDFANEMLLSVVHDFGTEGSGIKESIVGDNKDSGPEKGNQTFTGHEVSSDSHQLTSTSSASSFSVSEAQRRMSLYFALCIKKHSLLRQIFAIHGSMSKVAKLAVQGHIPILIRTTGASSELLGIISDPPAGSQSLTLQVLHTLTDGAIPPPELVASVKALYDTKLKDVEILIPVLSFLSKDEVISVFPQIVNLSPDKFQAALSRILKGSAHIGPILTPEEVLIAIHGIDPEKDKVALKKVMDACTSCFDQGQVFTQQVLAKVLNQLVEQIPLPLLFMRTVIQAIGAFPALVDFVMEILSRLVNKQIWKYPKLWVGFLKCAAQTKPQSFSVLLQLPAAQLENALNRNPILKAPLIERANQPDIRTTLPRSTLVVLGLAQDPQNQPATQVTQNLTNSSNSAADAGTEPTQDSGANS